MNSLPNVINIVANFSQRNPDLEVSEIFNGEIRGFTKKKPRYFLKDEKHPELLAGEKFCGNIDPNQFEVLRIIFPSARLGEQASLCHTSNGKSVAELKPLFIKTMQHGTA